MSTVWHVRIDEKVLEKADKVTERLGTSTQELVRVFVTKIAESGKVPLQLESEPDEMLTPWELRAATLENFYDPAKTW